MIIARHGPPETRIYAVGDIHGRFDLLEEMFRKIDADRATHPHHRHVEILLGDLVDRGPDSASVIEAAIERKVSNGLIALLGNHDHYVIDALANPSTISHWLTWGGKEALQSWGLSPDRIANCDPTTVQSVLREAIPASHLAFIGDMPLTWQEGDILFVHAGIRPGVPINSQTQRDLTLIREPFHSDPRDHGVLVVHGHTPNDTPVVRSNRIGVDTMAYNSGTLTCAVIDGEELEFIVVQGEQGTWT